MTERLELHGPWLKPTFDEESLRTHGRVLVGVQKHWCADWDFMPIDETCPEFEACLCAREGRK